MVKITIKTLFWSILVVSLTCLYWWPSFQQYWWHNLGLIGYCLIGWFIGCFFGILKYGA